MRRHALAIASLFGTLSILASQVLAGDGPATERGREFPSRPLTLIVPAEPGGGTDTFARSLAHLVAPRLGQKVVLDNKSGGGGTLGITHLVAARPDGYTLAFAWNSPLTAAPHHFTVPYAPGNYVPVMSIGYSSYVLCARTSSGMSDARSFAQKLKASSGRLSYGHAGSGGTLHLAAERIFQRLGADLRSVPFGGAGEIAQALLAGQIDVYGGSLPPILPHIAKGTVSCPLLTSTDRNPAAPKAEGLDALGLADEETVLWWGLFAPAGTPVDVVGRIELAFMGAAGTDEFRDLVENKGAKHRLLAGAETGAMLQREFTALSGVAKIVAMQKQRY